MINPETRELITARKASHKHSSKDLESPMLTLARYASNTKYINTSKYKVHKYK